MGCRKGLVAGIAVAWCLALALPAHAQQGGGGGGQWIVIKAFANPAKDGPPGEIVVGRFGSFEEAEESRRRLSRSSYDWAYFVKEVGAAARPRVPHWMELFRQAREVAEGFQFWHDFKEDPLGALARRNEPPGPLED